jgi:DNA mismatch endonuclease, patch repair protein
MSASGIGMGDVLMPKGPKSNIEFWKGKFKNNVARDKRVRRELEGMGWRVAIIWECETANPESLREELKELLSR